MACSPLCSPKSARVHTFRSPLYGRVPSTATADSASKSCNPGRVNPATQGFPWWCGLAGPPCRTQTAGGPCRMIIGRKRMSGAVLITPTRIMRGGATAPAIAAAAARPPGRLRPGGGGGARHGKRRRFRLTGERGGGVVVPEATSTSTKYARYEPSHPNHPCVPIASPSSLAIPVAGRRRPRPNSSPRQRGRPR